MSAIQGLCVVVLLAIISITLTSIWALLMKWRDEE